MASSAVEVTNGMTSKVQLTIIEAARLRKTQIFGKQDPFVVVKMKGNHRCKTRVDEDGGAFPTWQQRLPDFKFQPGDDVLIDFEIWNQNSMSDTLIGESRVRLSQLRRAPNGTMSLNVLYKGKPYGSSILKVQAKFDEKAPSQSKSLGNVGVTLLSKHFEGGEPSQQHRKRASLASLASLASINTNASTASPTAYPMAATQSSTPSPALAASMKGIANVAMTGAAFRSAGLNAKAHTQKNNGIGIGFRPGYQPSGANVSASTMATVALASQRFRAGASRNVSAAPVATVASNWQQAGRQAQVVGVASAAFRAPYNTGFGSSNILARSASALSVSSAVSSHSYARSASASSMSNATNDSGPKNPVKNLNLTPHHRQNGTAFALTFVDGSLGLALVPTAFGYAMLSDYPDPGSQASKYDLLPGDYVIAIGVYPLAKPGYMGVDGVVTALGLLQRPVRIAFFRFDFNKAFGKSTGIDLGRLPHDEPPAPSSQAPDSSIAQAQAVPSPSPPPPPPRTEAMPSESDWKEDVDPISGKKYYFNKKTNDVSWTLPKPKSQPKLPTSLAISPQARAAAYLDPAEAAKAAHDEQFPKTSEDGSALFVTQHGKTVPKAPDMSEEDALNTKVQQFMMMVGVGACPRERILQLLNMAGGDVNRAINYFFSEGR